jgi:hypothetical protein
LVPGLKSWFISHPNMLTRSSGGSLARSSFFSNSLPSRSSIPLTARPSNVPLTTRLVPSTTMSQRDRTGIHAESTHVVDSDSTFRNDAARPSVRASSLSALSAVLPTSSGTPNCKTASPARAPSAVS